MLKYLKIRVFSDNKRMVKNSCIDQGTASINVDPRSKQAMPKLLPTRLAQTRVLKQRERYQIDHTY